ncbi:peptidylprolyl isomerase [Sphingomonas sp. ac-8]|uniref:peptidylprolyl isomerase n=1 Tax=Sphingomonas sp. ac-8 TaxID=3242977 RepID=UPI003A7FCED5
MLNRLFLFVAALIAVPALAQTPASPPPAPGTARVALNTSEGRVVIELETTRAPITAANFLRYVDQKRLDGTVFYRTVRVTPEFGFVQFGVQNEPKRVLPPIEHESTTQTGVRHVDGAISVARLAPGTAQGDFTISVGAQPSLDADPSRPGDNLGYAAFGRVVEGMDVIHHILNAPVREGGHFKGEMLAEPIRVRSARRME